MRPYVDTAPPALLNFIRCGAAAALVWMLLPFGPLQPLFNDVTAFARDIGRIRDIGREACRVARDCCDDQAARLECICNRPSDPRLAPVTTATRPLRFVVRP